ncbi:hypothetical protein QPL79_01095 [Ignisphaera sp. 4213-co]|uniref:Uncharacterized protein n=1 Tax=Ignisphaera cupida TaxID=3050454 RepID=A0ABD4Z4R5_9CREN|nr:hypothetical protein [Ignisphaera sp. 4213-co]MDK6027962.1 hypothetical protein [Ignisphaera sp. 4213-co]
MEIYEKVKTIFDKVLGDEKISSKEINELIESINKLNLDMKIWCSGDEARELMELCNEFEKNVSTITATLSMLAVLKAIREEIVLEDEAVGSFLKKVSNALNMFNNAIQKSMLLPGGVVLCKILKPCQIKFSLALPQYITLLPIDVAAHLSTLGFVEIIEPF